MKLEPNEVTEQTIEDLWAEIKALQRQLALLVEDDRYREDKDFNTHTKALELKLQELSQKMNDLTSKTFDLNQTTLQNAIKDMKSVQDKIQAVLDRTATAVQIAEALEILGKVVLPFI